LYELIWKYLWYWHWHWHWHWLPDMALPAWLY